MRAYWRDWRGEDAEDVLPGHRPRAGAAWREGLPAAAPGRWQSELRDTWRQLLRVLRIALLCYLVAMALAPAPKRIPVSLQPTWVDR